MNLTDLFVLDSKIPVSENAVPFQKKSLPCNFSPSLWHFYVATHLKMLVERGHLALQVCT